MAPISFSNEAKVRTAAFAVTLAVTFGHEVHLQFNQKPLQSIMKKSLVRHYSISYASLQ